MKPEYHIIVSAAVSSGVYFYFNSFWAALISFSSGIFIDLDHILDYTLQNKKISLRFRDYYLFSLEKQFSKVFLFFHSSSNKLATD